MRVTWRRVTSPTSTPFPPRFWQRIPPAEQLDLYWWLISRATKATGPVTTWLWIVAASLYRGHSLGAAYRDIE